MGGLSFYVRNKFQKDAIPDAWPGRRRTTCICSTVPEAVFSVESNHHEFAEGNDEAAAEEEKEIQRKSDKPDTRRKIMQRICDDCTGFAPVAEITGLLKEPPKLQSEKLHCNTEWKNEIGSHPVIGTEITVSCPVPMDRNSSGMGKYSPERQRNAQPEQGGADRMPVDGFTAQHGKEIFQWCSGGFSVLLRVVAVHKVRKAQAKSIRKRLQRVDIRQTDSRFP